MITGERKVGAASCRVRQTNAVPERMRARVREVTALRTEASEQGKGYATTLMHKVCREADAANMVLILYPLPFGAHQGLGLSYLESWYEARFGFAIIQHEPVLMARMPGATPRMLTLNPIAEAMFKEKTQ